MGETYYNIIFKGGTAEGRDIAEVKKSLSVRYKVKAEQIDRFFSGQPVVLTKNIDYETAMKYQTAFTRIGILCLVEPSKSDIHTKSTYEAGKQNNYKMHDERANTLSKEEGGNQMLTPVHIQCPTMKDFKYIFLMPWPNVTMKFVVFAIPEAFNKMRRKHKFDIGSDIPLAVYIKKSKHIILFTDKNCYVRVKNYGVKTFSYNEIKSISKQFFITLSSRPPIKLPPPSNRKAKKKLRRLLIVLKDRDDYMKWCKERDFSLVESKVINIIAIVATCIVFLLLLTRVGVAIMGLVLATVHILLRELITLIGKALILFWKALTLFRKLFT